MTSSSATLRRSLGAVALALLVGPGASAVAVPQAEEAPPIEQQEAPDVEASPESQADATNGDDDWHALEEDPCSIDAEGNWIDWMNQKVTKSVCGSARWFDNFFGTARGDVERDATFGRLGLGLLWDEDDGFGSDVRFRAKVHFPNMNDRVNATFGRGNTDEILDEQGGTEPPQDAFFDDESEWLVGFGYHLTKSDRNRLTFGLGSSFSDGSLDPYVRLRYIYNRPLRASHLRLRLVPQWQESKGAGATAKLSIDRSIGERILLRWETVGRGFEKRFDGLSYGTSLQLFQQVGVGRAMRYLVGIWGQSGFEHQPEDWGVQVTLRDSIYKEIFFIEVLTGVNFRRRDEDPEREAKYLAGLFFELKFGR